MHILAEIVVVDYYVPGTVVCMTDVAANKTGNAPSHMVFVSRVIMRQLAKRQKSIPDGDTREVKQVMGNSSGDTSEGWLCSAGFRG